LYKGGYQRIFGQKSISMVVIMSKFNQRLLTLYNNKKNLSNPPSYMEDLKQILKLDGLLGEDGYLIQENNKEI
jgi:hypothetical protein